MSFLAHRFIANAKLRHKLSVVCRVDLVSIHVELNLQVHIACLQSTATTSQSAATELNLTPPHLTQFRLFY